MAVISSGSMPASARTSSQVARPDVVPRRRTRRARARLGREARVEQEDAARVPDRVGDDDAGLARVRRRPSGNVNSPVGSAMTSISGAHCAHERLEAESERGGGEGGIRTRDALPRTAFPVRRHSPLGDLSARRDCGADVTSADQGRHVAGAVDRLRAGRIRTHVPCRPLFGAARVDRPEPRQAREVRVTEAFRAHCSRDVVRTSDERVERSREQRADGGRPVRSGCAMAERVGFEPTLLSQTAFRERHHQPLGHLSAREDTSGPGQSSRAAAATSARRRRRAPRPRPGGCR